MSTGQQQKQRRAAMRAYGRYLDWVQWTHRVRLGLEEPPEGYTLADMCQSSIRLQEEYQELANAYAGLSGDTE